MSFVLIRVDAAPLPNVTGRGVTARQESHRKLLLLRNITEALADCEWIGIVLAVGCGGGQLGGRERLFSPGLDHHVYPVPIEEAKGS